MRDPHATTQKTVDFLLEQMAGAGDVSARAIFGEFGIYCDGKIVALVCGNELYVKPTAAGRAFIGEVIEAPPYQGAKPSRSPASTAGRDKISRWTEPVISCATACATAT